jgi:integrase
MTPRPTPLGAAIHGRRGTLTGLQQGPAEPAALRELRRPRVAHKVIEPVADDLLRRLLSVCSVRDRAIVLLMVDTGLRSGLLWPLSSHSNVLDL